jgi:predicted glycosyltransferase
MNILIDINHPAHVHYFRNFSKIMEDKGHKILIVSRNKEMEHQLLRLYGFSYISRGKGRNGRLGKFFYLLYADLKLFQIARKFKADLFLSFLHPYPSHAAKLQGKVSLVFSDTEHARLHHKLTVPFATKVFTPSCYRINLGEKQVPFKGYMELAYLHPNYFTPDPGVLKLLNVKQNEKYVIIRFVSWTAIHDYGHSGMTLENKRKAIRLMSQYAKVFITAEDKLPDDLEKYRIRIPLNKIHDAIYFSSLLFGESGTMSSEAAVLGTPAIFINSIQLGYLDDEEFRYGLVHNFIDTPNDQEDAIQKALEILSDEGGKEKYHRMRKNLLSDCIDTTQFMVDEVLKYDNAPHKIRIKEKENS